MEAKLVLKKVLEDYKRITGLRSYIVYEPRDIQSASEKNYFCKCLKLSSKALAECEQCTQDYFINVIENEDENAKDKVITYACHAGLIKWAVPVNEESIHCYIISEGVIAREQIEGAEKWAEHLSKQYQLNQEMLLQNFKIIQKMNEVEMNASIALLKDLIHYHFAMNKA